MKNTISCLLGIIGLLSACSKKKDAAGPEQQQQEKAVSRLMTDTDTTRMVYHADGRLQQFKQYGRNQGLKPDSTQVLYENGNISRFRIWAFGDLRDDRSFQYNTERQLVKVNYYNMVSETELAVTDRDSIVYKQGKPAELHVISGSQRNEVYRLTWNGDNISKTDHYLVIGEDEVLFESTSLVYADKPGFGRSFPGYFLFLLSNTSRDFTALSAQAPLKAETTELPGETPVIRVLYEFTYNGDGLPEKIKNTAEVLPGGQQVEAITRVDYITLR